MKQISTFLVTCPHCGALKRIAFSTIPWSKAESIMWSDGHIESTEWCEPALIQQCPSCKHFFALPPKHSLKVEDVPCENTGSLPYQTLKQAITELAGDDVAESNTRLEAWWAYNKLYQDVLDDDIPVEEKDFNRSNMQWLLDYYSKEPFSPYSLIFELHRLLGNIEEYKKLLGEMTYERFVEWRAKRNQKKGIDSSLDEQQLRRMYSKLIEEKKDALDKLLKPYIMHKNI
jgi:hypothetical protein